MVIIEPFEYQKITAFKERVQIISKVNEIVDAINNGDIGIQEDEVITLIENELLNYYTKAEVDDAIASIDLSDFYTKSETNGMLSLKRDISDSYNKTEVDSKDTALGNRIDACENSISMLIDDKQDVLTPLDPILIDNNTIFIDKTLWKLCDTIDWTAYFENNGSPGANNIAKEDVLVYFACSDGSTRQFFYVPKNSTTNFVMIDTNQKLHFIRFRDKATYLTARSITETTTKIISRLTERTSATDIWYELEINQPDTGAISYQKVTSLNAGWGTSDKVMLWVRK